MRTVTGATERAAIDTLRAVGWGSVEQAVEQWYAQGGGETDGGGNGGGATSAIAAAEALFLEYKDSHTDSVLAEGIARLCDDLGVDPSDPVMLALSWRWGAATMCEWSRDEFVGGMRGILGGGGGGGGASGGSSASGGSGTAAATAAAVQQGLAALKGALPGLRREMGEPQKFSQMYAYAFGWAAEKGQKCLQLDTALAMWRLLLGEGTPRPGGPWPLLERWLDFLKKAHAGRAVGRDTWVQLLEFVRTVRADMSDYDENGAWPYLLDEFVEQCRKDGTVTAA